MLRFGMDGVAVHGVPVEHAAAAAAVVVVVHSSSTVTQWHSSSAPPRRRRCTNWQPMVAPTGAPTGPPWRPAPFLRLSLPVPPCASLSPCVCLRRRAPPPPATLDPLLATSRLAALVPRRLLYIPPPRPVSAWLLLHPPSYMLNLARQTLKRVPSFQEILQGTMGSAKEEMYLHRFCSSCPQR